MMKHIHLVHLYPKEMNIYGDTGNRLIIKKRIEWRNYHVNISLVGIGDTVPSDADIIIGGGGQDTGQSIVQQDLADKASTLQQMAADGVVMLMVCGLYQLFGRKFITHDDKLIAGIGIFPMDTIAGKERLIGNTVYETPFGKVVGYENHSGQTTLDDKSLALGKVLSGAGNNGQDKTEGCLVNNVFGTYSHGPVLSKNPELADELISRAILRKYGDKRIEPLDDELELTAKRLAELRPR